MKRKLIHRFFLVTVIVKGIDGVLEIVGGVVLLLFSHARIMHIVSLLTRHELSEDPHDVVANYLFRAASSLSVGAQTFIAIYLLSHGVIKVVLIAALLRRKLPAYPVAIAVFFLFIVYQQYRYTITHSLWLPALSVLDVIVIILTWLEYRHLREAKRSEARVAARAACVRAAIPFSPPAGW